MPEFNYLSPCTKFSDETLYVGKAPKTLDIERKLIE
jgi:hypothetical protein